MARFDGGDLYTREDVCLDDDMNYIKDILKLDIEDFDEKIKNLKVFIQYTAPEEKDVKEMKKTKTNSYEINEDVHLYKFNLLEFEQKTKTLNICEDLWMGYEKLIKNIIHNLANLEKIYFIGRAFYNKEELMMAEDEDLFIRESYNNPRWPDAFVLDPAEDKDDLEQLLLLRKEVEPRVKIEFQALSDQSEKLVKEMGISK
tara:strand:- start:161 stop:763 length:603 start_codon:yes stop_codon:yes gene_type:complete